MLMIWVVLVIWVAEQFLKMHSGKKLKGNDAGDLGCVCGWQNSFEDTFENETPKGNDIGVSDLGCVSDLGGRIVFENAQWRNVNNNGDLDVLVIWVAE